MRGLPAFLAFCFAVLIFLFTVLIVSWGWQRGYSDPALYRESLAMLAGVTVGLLASVVMLLAALRGWRVPIFVMLIVLAGSCAAIILTGWVLLFDPGDAAWMVPLFGGFAACSVWSVLGAMRQRRG